MGKEQTTTPGTPCPTLYDECVGYLTFPASHYSKDTGDGAYGLSSLSEKTRISNHLQMSLQRQHILLSYFKTLSVAPVWDSNPRPPVRYSDALPTELTGHILPCTRDAFKRPINCHLFVEIWHISSFHLSARNQHAEIFGSTSHE